MGKHLRGLYSTTRVCLTRTAITRDYFVRRSVVATRADASSRHKSIEKMATSPGLVHVDAFQALPLGSVSSPLRGRKRKREMRRADAPDTDHWYQFYDQSSALLATGAVGLAITKITAHRAENSPYAKQASP